jgi:hypothetical protein
VANELGGRAVDKVTRAVARGLVVALVVLGLASVPSAGAQAATAPQEGEHDVVVNPDPVDTTAQVLDGNTQAVLDFGTRVIVGGKFTQVKRYSQNTVLARNHLFAYDKATGAIDTTFVPQLDGQVTALVKATDGTIYVAGQFRNVNGTPAPYLVKLNPMTGALVTAFNTTPNGMVYDLELRGNVLYAAGTFTKIRNLVRTNFAAVDATTGKATALDLPFTAAVTGTTRVLRIDASPDGTSMVAIGNFTQVGGQYRPNIVKLDLTTSPVSVGSWFTDMFRYGLCSSSYDTYVRDVDFSPDGSYFAVVSTGAYGTPPRLCDSASRWETATTGTATPTWAEYTGGDSLTAVAVTGAAVYVGGHQRWQNNATAADRKGTGALDRQGIAALDPVSGTVLSWNPGRDRGLAVWRIVPTEQGLYVLNDSLNFGGEYHPRLTYLLTTGGSAPVRATTFSVPTNLAYTGSTLVGATPAAGQLSQRPFDGTILGDEATSADTSSWSDVTGVISANGVAYRLTTNQRFQVSTDAGATWSPLASWTDGRFGTITSATYANGFLYYTLNNDARLYTVGFGVENGLVTTTPAQVVSGDGDGLGWSAVRGMAFVGGHLLASSSDGKLFQLDLAGRRPVPASLVQLSGPGVDSLDWSTVRALHAEGQAALPPAPKPLVEEHFDLGLDAWSNMVGFTLDGTTGGPTGTAPSAKVDVSGTRGSGIKAFTSATATEVCATLAVNLNRTTANTVLMRLRTAANGPVGRVFVNASRQLYVRSDVAGQQLSTGITLALGSWYSLELCAKTATDGYLALKVDGVAAPVWSGNLGTTNAGAIEIGDAAANNWSANFDDVVVRDPNL